MGIKWSLRLRLNPFDTSARRNLNAGVDSALYRTI
jgi:hypothetical protein